MSGSLSDCNAILRPKNPAREALVFGDAESGGGKKQRKKPADHNARTKRLLESYGYFVERVDHFDTRTGRAHDLLGIFDLLALKKGSPPLGIQLSSKSNISARVKKLRESKTLAFWLGAGCKAWVIGWEKSVSAGGAVSYKESLVKVTLDA